MGTAAAILDLAELWLWIGAAVAVPFLTFGVERIDENARGAYAFRPMIVPGVLLLWPLVLWRWAVLELDRDDWALRHAPPRRAHRIAALAMAAGIVVALGVGAWAIKTPEPVEPVRIGDPS